MSNAETGYWSEPFPWSPDRDPEAIPYNVKDGDIIKSDMMIRPHHLHKWPKHIYPQHIWVVNGGAAFQITQTVPQTCASFVINSFQIWGGTREELDAHEKQKLLELLNDALDSTTKKEIENV